MSNNESELSSEELLRQAREAYLDPPASSLPTSELTAESLQPPVSSLDTPIVPPVSSIPGLDRPAAEPLAAPPTSIPELEMATPELAPPAPVPPPPPVHSAMPVPRAKPRPPAASPQVQPPPPTAASPRQPGRVALPPVQTKSASRGNNLPWRLIIPIVIFGGIAIVGAIANRGTTSAGSIAVGDCYANPGFGDFERLTDQDCAGPHDMQVFARVTAGLSFNFDNFDAENPDIEDVDFAGPDSLGGKCEEALIELVATPQFNDPSVIVPADASMGELTSASSNSSPFSGEAYCVLESPSGGLVGSVLPDN